MPKPQRVTAPSASALHPSPERAGGPLFFFRQFLAHPRMVGSIIPTSAHTIRALLDHADWAQARVIVEYGPGTGVFTRELLRHARPDARVIAIDTNPAFVAYLGASLTDSRFTAVEGSAAQVGEILTLHGRDQADVIVSGLPFSTLPPGVGETITQATAQALAPGGVFLVYQYSRFVMRFLARHFGIIDERRVWRCVPPARLFAARRREGA